MSIMLYGSTKVKETAAKRHVYVATEALKYQEYIMTKPSHQHFVRHSSIRILNWQFGHDLLGLKACRHDLVAAFLQGQLQDDELIFVANGSTFSE